MSDQPKPPLSVWLDQPLNTKELYGFYSNKKENLHVEGVTKTFGPYVHRDQFLDQFMERVRERAEEIEKKLNLKLGEWNPSEGVAFHEIVKEIKEGKL